jgi:general secretion pathway protein K
MTTAGAARVRRGRRRNGREGVALMLVLLFVVLLTVLVVEFAYDTQVDASLASNQDSRFEATLAAKSAIAHAMSLLAEDVDPELIAQQQELVGIDPANPQGGANDPQYDVGRVDLGSGETWAIGAPFEPQNEATRRATVSDEYGKINLNALVFPSPDGDEMVRNEPLIASLRVLLSNRIENEDAAPLVDAIIDWVDYGDDDQEEPDGAESSYYEGLENPYPCKNGPMDSIEELFLIKGFTADFYYGDPTLDPPQLPLNEYLTVHGCPNGSVNINSAQEETRIAIMQGYSESGYNFPSELIPPYTSFSQLSQQMQGNSNRRRGQRTDTNGDGVIDERDDVEGGGGGEVPPFITWSNCFRIYGDGQHGTTMVRIEAYVWRSPVAGMEDQYIGQTMTSDQRRRFEDVMAQAETGSGAPQNTMFEQFRILDWKVIQ